MGERGAQKLVERNPDLIWMIMIMIMMSIRKAVESTLLSEPDMVKVCK